MENTSVHSLADEISPLTLAFVGDGVYDLLVREYLVRKANRSVGELNKIKVSLVNCKSQAEFAKVLMPTLTEKELAVYKRLLCKFARLSHSCSCRQHRLQNSPCNVYAAVTGYLGCVFAGIAVRCTEY